MMYLQRTNQEELAVVLKPGESLPSGIVTKRAED
jgi:hypothetical protein